MIFLGAKREGILRGVSRACYELMAKEKGFGVEAVLFNWWYFGFYFLFLLGKTGTKRVEATSVWDWEGLL